MSPTPASGVVPDISPINAIHLDLVLEDRAECVSAAAIVAGDSKLARSQWRYVIHRIAATAGDADARAAADAVIAAPCPVNLFHLLERCRGREFEQMLLEALAFVAVAASTQILGGDHE